MKAARCWPGLPDGAPRVLVEEAFLERLARFGERSAMAGREAGAFILGKAEMLRDGWQIALEELQEVEGEADAESFTFPAEAFLKAHQRWRTWSVDEIAARPGATCVVGWCHTHPGHGVFLSPPDLEVQHRKFPLPFQIALVVDPLAESADRRMGLVAWVGEGTLSPHLPDGIAYFPTAAPRQAGQKRPFAVAGQHWNWGILPLLAAAGWWLWHHGF